jgi:crotonobetainyl-CoA:carnitine CoA-transferase CaiB-like acyl-CoA transferase
VLKAIDQEGLTDEPRFATAKLRRENLEPFMQALDAGFARFTLDEIGERLTATDIIWAPLYAPRDVVADPIAEAAGCFVETSDASGARFRAPASPARFPGADDGPKGPAPTLGQHTREVLGEAGYTPDEIDRLIAEGAAT